MLHVVIGKLQNGMVSGHVDIHGGPAEIMASIAASVGADPAEASALAAPLADGREVSLSGPNGTARALALGRVGA